MFKIENSIAVTEPVNLADTKAHCRIEISDDDALITALIVSAREFAEKYTQKLFVDHEYQITYDAGEFALVQCLSVANSIGTVSKLDFTDEDVVVTDIVATHPTLFKTVDRRLIVESDLIALLGTEADYEAWTLIYQLSPVLITDSIRQAIYMTVCHWYENRESVMDLQSGLQVIPQGVIAILNSLKKYSV